MTTAQQLIARGAAALQSQLGTTATISRSGTIYWTGPLVFVETGSGYETELGGSVYFVNSRAAVLASAISQAPLPGDRLRVNGRLFMVAGVFRSSFDATYNLDCASLK